MNLARALNAGRTLRAIGFDDSPFDKHRTGQRVLACGVVCAGTRFEGMVTTHIRKDGWNATSRIIEALTTSKFLDQVHLVMLDGIAMGGFNVVDIGAVESAIQIPVVAVMRNRPDMSAIEAALSHLTRPARRLELIRRAGEVHEATGCFFQVVGAEPATARTALEQFTDVGHIPEPIRLAHMIGSAVVSGQSGRRA